MSVWITFSFPFRRKNPTGAGIAVKIPAAVYRPEEGLGTGIHPEPQQNQCTLNAKIWSKRRKVQLSLLSPAEVMRLQMAASPPEIKTSEQKHSLSPHWKFSCFILFTAWKVQNTFPPKINRTHIQHGAAADSHESCTRETWRYTKLCRFHDGCKASSVEAPRED